MILSGQEILRLLRRNKKKIELRKALNYNIILYVSGKVHIAILCLLQDWRISVVYPL